MALGCKKLMEGISLKGLNNKYVETLNMLIVNYYTLDTNHNAL